MRQLFVGLITEGSTDVRFLKNVVFKSVQDLCGDCENDIEVFDIKEVKAEGGTFVEKMLNASHKASVELGLSMLCIHADADDKTSDNVLHNKFEPFFKELSKMSDEEYCKRIVPTIPIQMIESWMLADKELLKQMINAQDMRDIDLGIEKTPEAYADPKEVINDAIRIAMSRQSKKKRDQIKISDLYEVLGTRLTLEKLRAIPSYDRFEQNIKNVFKEIGILR